MTLWWWAKSSTFSAALQQRPHERAHVGRLGAASGLPLVLADLILDQRAAREALRPL